LDDIKAGCEVRRMRSPLLALAIASIAGASIAGCSIAGCSIAGCSIDAPVRLPPVGGGPPADRLSELGLDGAIPYEVIAPLWSDGADKARGLVAPIPLGATDDAWIIPVGTYLVKTFALGGRRVETRVIAYLDDGPRFATYLWNAAQTEAFASGGNLDVDAGGQVFHVPGTSQCTACHAAGALGLRTPQLAGALDALVAAGVIAQRPARVDPFVDPYGDGDLEPRAASYLDANCAHCHRPDGEAAGTGVDWRRDHLRDNLCRAAGEAVAGRRLVIAPGRPDASVTIARMTSGDPFVHMPRGPSHIVDDRGLAVVSAWIASLPVGCP
jgi:mono/diheme cytochrome c family protein